MRMFQVGGCVRDRLLGIESKDIDFAVEAKDFAEMRWELTVRGFKIFLETPEFLTIRARFPKGHKDERMTADFVLCRRDSAGSDGRRPDFVEAGTLADDLARRDFTVNAMAEAEDGTLIDLFGGKADLDSRTLRFVGDPQKRLAEDALRALRGIRFCITKGFKMDALTFDAISKMDPAKLTAVSVERRREEMLKCFQHDTISTMRALVESFSPEFIEAIFKDGLWLMPTLKG